MTTQTATMLTISERLHVARERAGVKVGEMATRLGRHRNRVTAYEDMGNNVPMWVILTYAEHLDNGTTVEWLTAEVGPPPRRDIDGYPVAITHGLDTDQLTLWSTADIATSVDLRDVSEPARREVVTGTATLSLQGSTAA